MAVEKINRRQQILEVLAYQLESEPGSRITTAGLAHAVGVSEAALYRHFPSKAKMFEALIAFAEQSMLGLVNRIAREHRDVAERCESVIMVLLRFSEKNPGITRILVGDALVGENEQLRARVAQLFDRLLVQLKQMLRESVLVPDGPQPSEPATAIAELLVALLDGQMVRYVRSNFLAKPTDHREAQWRMLRQGMFHLTR